MTNPFWLPLYQWMTRPSERFERQAEACQQLARWRKERQQARLERMRSDFALMTERQRHRQAFAAIRERINRGRVR